MAKEWKRCAALLYVMQLSFDVHVHVVKGMLWFLCQHHYVEVWLVKTLETHCIQYFPKVLCTCNYGNHDHSKESGNFANEKSTKYW